MYVRSGKGGHAHLRTVTFTLNSIRALADDMFSLLKRADVSRAGRKKRFTGTAEGCLLFHVLLPHLKIQTALLAAPSQRTQEFPQIWTPIQTLIRVTVQSESSQVQHEELKDNSVDFYAVIVLSHLIMSRAC